MDAKKLVEIRRQAEKAVADMADGEVKVKAFEVILNHLLQGDDTSHAESDDTKKDPKAKRDTKDTPERTIGGRILVLRNEGFFKNQKTIGETREELRVHGWHYPLTTLSGTLQGLVRRRELRREWGKQGNKKILKYSNP